jgi:hypothetical protein
MPTSTDSLPPVSPAVPVYPKSDHPSEASLATCQGLSAVEEEMPQSSAEDRLSAVEEEIPQSSAEDCLSAVEEEMPQSLAEDRPLQPSVATCGE